jgi:hypothetical protein
MSNRNERPLTENMKRLYSLLDAAWVEGDENDEPELDWVYLHRADHAALTGLLSRRIGREIKTRTCKIHGVMQAAFNTPH